MEANKFVTAFYHETSKLAWERLEPRGRKLDPALLLSRFRFYTGAPIRSLPKAPARPVPLSDLFSGHTLAVFPGPLQDLLSGLLWYSVAISGYRHTPSGETTPLRVVPSAGNLHPVEVYLATAALPGWDAGLYHYRVPDHTLEQRGTGNWVEWLSNLAGKKHRPDLIALLTVVPSRSAWKYGERAFRYCLLDAGHAVEALRLAGLALGLRVEVVGGFSDDAVTQKLKLTDEWPVAFLKFWLPTPCGLTGPPTPPALLPNEPSDAGAGSDLPPLLRQALEATKASHGAPIQQVDQRQSDANGARLSPVELPGPAELRAPFDSVVRKRRSATEFDSQARPVRLDELAALLWAAWAPLTTDFSATEELSRVEIHLFAHSVEQIDPGVYRYCPSARSLIPIRLGPQRSMARQLAFGQSLAGSASVTFVLVANLEAFWQAHGERGYRYAHLLAGIIGHRLYLGAEALGLRASGIGAYLDDDLQRYLELPSTHQPLYLVACGFPISGFEPRD